MTALALADLRSRRRSIAALSGGCFVLLLVLAGTYSAYGGATAFTRVFGAGHVPKLLSALSGSSSADIFSPGNFLAFGFNHPLFLVLTISVTVSAGVAAVAGDVETGRAELLFTAPMTRTSILTARALAWLAAEVAVVAAAVVGALLGSRLSSQLSAVSPLIPLRVALQYSSLALFVAAVAFTGSCFARSRGAAMGIALGVAAGSYVVNLIALLWHPLAWARRVTPFGYYSPTTAATHVQWGDMAVLLLAAAAVAALGQWQLGRRDLA